MEPKITSVQNYCANFMAEGEKGYTYGLTEEEARANYEAMR